MQEIQLINPFSTPFVISNKIDPMMELIMSYFNIKDQKTQTDKNSEHTINNHYEAAEYMLNNPDCRHLNKHIKNYLRTSKDYKNWRKKMPSKTPKGFTNRQRNYAKYKFFDMTNDFININFYLPAGQILFHGGKWQCGNNEFMSDLPLSTTFSPEVALRNAEWKAKAYHSNEINLWLIKNCSTTTKAFVYRIAGTRKGDEQEVLIQSKCKMFLKNKTLIHNNYEVANYHSFKKVNAYLLEVEIST